MEVKLLDGRDLAVGDPDHVGPEPHDVAVVGGLLDRDRLDQRLSVAAGVRQVDFLSGEIDQLDQLLGADAITDPDALRLMTLPGVSVVTAIALLAAIGDITRFATPRELVAYLGLDPRVRQSGSVPARHGRISKQGAGEVRGLLVEAAWHAARTPGPLHGFHARLALRRGSKIATVATARKMVVIAWHLLSRGQEYAFVRPALYREKLRKLELLLGAPRRQGQSPSGHVPRVGVGARRTDRR